MRAAIWAGCQGYLRNLIGCRNSWHDWWIVKCNFGFTNNESDEPTNTAYYIIGMAPLGCRGSVCQGMTIISSFLNAVGGVALVIVAIMVVSSPLAKGAGLMIPCFAAAGLGGVLVLIGVTNIIAAIKEKRPVIKAMVILIIIMAVLLGGILIFVVLSGKKSYDNLKSKYMNEFDAQEREKIHKNFKCCGMDTIADAKMTNAKNSQPSACQFSIPCVKPIKKELKKKIQILIYVNGGVVLLQLFAAFAAGCLMRKMRHVMEKERKKQKHIPLAEQYKMQQQTTKKGKK